jgi:hypothetical protein
MALHGQPMVINQRGHCEDCGHAVERVVHDARWLDATPWSDGLSDVEREFWGDD